MTTNYSDLPKFSDYSPEYIENVINKLLVNNLSAIKKIISQSHKYTWDNLVSPIEILESTLSYVLNITSHLCEVMSSPELAAVYSQMISSIINYRINILHNQNIFNAYSSLYDLSESQKSALQVYLNQHIRAGINLKPELKNEIEIMSSRLSQLGRIFEDNVFTAMNSTFKHILDVNNLDGIPDNLINLMRDEAVKQKKTGYLIRLIPDMHDSILKFSTNRNLRKEIYHLYSTLASNNHPIMIEILELRSKAANLSHYKNYVEYSLSNKTLKTPEDVYDFLNQLTNQYQNIARFELQELEEFACSAGINDLNAWDMLYYSHQLKKNKFYKNGDIDNLYFPQDKVFKVLFGLMNNLFKISIIELKYFDKWHPDVKLFEIYDANNQLRGRFYMDLYLRPGKHIGAWCSELRPQFKNILGSQIPMVCIVTNITKKIGSEGPEFNHQDMIGIFHEFGHCLQKLMTQVDYSVISGDNGLPLDTTELVSLFMEHWCWEDNLLINMLKKTDKNPTVENNLIMLKQVKSFQRGLKMMREIVLSLFDLNLHSVSFSNDPLLHIADFLNKIKKEMGFLHLNVDHLAHTFLHIFSSMFAAGYYSYLFSEILADDAFTCFERNGLFCQKTGMKFLSTILEQSGAKNSMDLFNEFKTQSSLNPRN